MRGCSRRRKLSLWRRSREHDLECCPRLSRCKIGLAIVILVGVCSVNRGAKARTIVTVEEKCFDVDEQLSEERKILAVELGNGQ